MPGTVPAARRRRALKGHFAVATNSDEWVTPRWILEPLGPFDLDPCTPECGMPWPTAAVMWTKREDGLATPWPKGWRPWVNPPYSRRQAVPWLERLAGHGSGLALLPFRAEVAWFREWVWRRAAAFLVLDRRPFFHVAPSGERAPHNCGEAVCLVAYADAEAAVLRGCGLGGEYVETRHIVHAPARSEPRPDLPPDLCSTALDYT